MFLILSYQVPYAEQSPNVQSHTVNLPETVDPWSVHNWIAELYAAGLYKHLFECSFLIRCREIIIITQQQLYFFTPKYTRKKNL